MYHYVARTTESFVTHQGITMLLEHITNQYHYVARTTESFVTHQGGSYVSLCCSYNRKFCNTPRWIICITMLLVQQNVL